MARNIKAQLEKLEKKIFSKSMQTRLAMQRKGLATKRMRVVAQSLQVYELYHGSSEPKEVFETHGIKPDDRGYVSLTDNPELAIQYAQSDQDRTNQDNVTLVTVNVYKLDEANLIPDPDHEGWIRGDETNQLIEIETWEDGLKANDQCVYLGPIPRTAIINIEEL